MDPTDGNVTGRASIGISANHTFSDKSSTGRASFTALLIFSRHLLTFHDLEVPRSVPPKSLLIYRMIRNYCRCFRSQ
jgi:hypothetical protein